MPRKSSPEINSGLGGNLSHLFEKFLVHSQSRHLGQILWSWYPLEALLNLIYSAEHINLLNGAPVCLSLKSPKKSRMPSNLSKVRNMHGAHAGGAASSLFATARILMAICRPSCSQRKKPRPHICAAASTQKAILFVTGHIQTFEKFKTQNYRVMSGRAGIGGLRIL